MCSVLPRAALRLVVASLLFVSSLAQAVSLEWDRNNDTNVVGYRVYFGRTSRSYSSVIDANNQTSVALPTLQAGNTYFFAVTAYTSDGVESDFSQEISYSTPPPNGAPVAVPDHYQTIRNISLNVSSADGVLDNDYDPEEDQIAALLVSSTTHGTLVFDYSGSFTYSPALDFTGTDFFTYNCTDGINTSAVVTVTITVAPPPNHSPVAQDDSYQTLQDTPLNVKGGGVLNNDSDADADPLSALLVSAPAHGTLMLGINGDINYSPTIGFAGTDAFTYRCSDGQATSSVAVVTITVTAVVTPPPPNHTPIAQDDIYSMAQDTRLTITSSSGILTNDFDEDGDQLTAVLVSTTSHGTLGLANNGAFIYSPFAGFSGTDTFMYVCTDGKATSDVAMATITIDPGVAPPPTNNPPVAQADNYQTLENTTLNVSSAAGILSNDLDAEGDLLAAVLVTSPIHGTLSFDNNGAFIYTPAARFAGRDVFTYFCTDGSATSELATVTITIASNPNLPNNAPVAHADSYQAVAGATLNVNVANGLLSNDSDADYDPITALLVSSTAHGILILSSNGSFTYSPFAGFTGTDAFTYRCSDGRASSAVVAVTLNVVAFIAPPPPPNHVPVAQDDNYQANQNTPLYVTGAAGILTNDSDADSDPLAVLVVSYTSHGTLALNSNGEFTYLPSQSFVGADGFSYCVTDGKATSAVATVTINVVGGSDSSGCPECLAQLEPVLAARGGSLSALLTHVTVPENSTCLESELIQFYTVAKTLGHVNDSQLNGAINATASCLGANLEAELIKRQTKMAELLPSKWSVLAGKRVMTISNQLQQAAGTTDASARTKKFLSAAASLRYVDKYVASGRLAPDVISNQVYWCRFLISGRTVERLLALNNNGWFILKDMDGNPIANDFYVYQRTAYDSGTFQLLLDGANVTTLNFKFGATRGKISGDMRGWFTPQ